jgi:hypothetical protein
VKVGKPEDHSEDLNTDGKIILKWILGEKGVTVSTLFNWVVTISFSIRTLLHGVG